MADDATIKKKAKELFELNKDRKYYNLSSAAKQICKLLGDDTTACKKRVAKRLKALFDANSKPRLAGGRLYPE